MTTTSGHFFFVAGIYNGTQRYCYKKIARAESQYSEDNYPIFLTLSPRSFAFRISAYHTQVLGNEKFPGYYGTGTICDIDFTLNPGEEITKWMTDAGQISTLAIDNEIYRKNKKLPERLCYSNLKCWEPTFDSKQDKADSLLSKRELMLDFLFDLFHSDVFDNNEGAKSLKVAIKKTQLSNGIFAKSEFNYFKEKLTNKKSRLDSPSNKDSAFVLTEKEIQWHVAKFIESSSYFVTFLRDSETENTLNRLSESEKQDKWFDHIEIEHKRVFEICKYPAFRKEANMSSQWFLQRYSMFFAMKLQMKESLSPIERGIIWLVAILIIIKSGLPQFYDDSYYTIWGLTSVTCVVLVGVAFAFGFIIERVFFLLFQIIRGFGTNIAISSLLNGIKIFLPKVLLINLITWWWILHSYGDNTSLEDALNMFDSICNYFLLYYIIVLTGLALKTVDLPSMHNSKRLIIRSIGLSFIAFSTSLCIGIAFFTFMQPDAPINETICWVFSGREYVANKIEPNQLYILALMAASLGIIFELSANSIIEILSP